MMASVENCDWAVFERMRRATSMRSRIVLPTVVSVEESLPPTSQWTASAEVNYRKASSGTRCASERKTSAGSSPN